MTLNAEHRGSQADIKLYEEAPLPPEVANKPRLADKGDVDSQQPEIRTPHKKPKGGGELTEAQKAANKAMASTRVAVEHAIRRVKGGRVMRDDYRLVVGLFPLIAAVVVGLVQL